LGVPVRIWLGAPNIMKIAKDRRNIEFKIKYWKQRLEDLQDECPHLEKEKTSAKLGENLCNWCICTECGKVWLEK
jgi:hypothetical protein